jgi:hypothetical protein
MSVDLDSQLREYCQHMDEEQGALSFEDVLERTGEIQVIPGRGEDQPPSSRKWIVAAAAAFAVLIIAIGIRFLPVTDQTPEPAEQPTTTLITTPTTVAMVIHGWPDTGENTAGVYSWDGGRCAGTYCVVGFMHNGYGSGDVEILFNVLAAKPTTDERTTSVTIAGHDGTYRRLDALREEWIVDIEGTLVSISLNAEPDASQADLAEAHAIIDSIRTEPSDNERGFRLVFTLSTNDWDSG